MSRRRKLRRLSNELLEARYLLASVAFVSQEPVERLSVRSSFLVDLDGDTDLDVLSVTDEALYVTKRLGPDDYAPPEQIWTGSNELTVAIADADDDGDIDILLASERRIFWLLNDGRSGRFSVGPHVADLTLGRGVEAISAYDFHGDGDLDILYVERISHLPYLVVNDTSYESPIELGALSGEDAFAIVAADIDNDGDLDVVTSAEDGAVVTWYRNDQVTFSEAPPIARPWNDGANEFALADMDGDGDIDVIAGAEDESSTLVWYDNDGKGTFDMAHPISNLDARITGVLAADFDQDGDVDVITSSAASDEQDQTLGLLLHLNRDGLGGFTDAESVILADYEINRVSFGRDATGIEFVIRPGSGTAVLRYAIAEVSVQESAVVTHDSQRLASMTSFDMDGDGDEDIVTASAISGTIRWYETRDNEAFSLSHSIATDFFGGLTSVAVGDIDGDGDADIVATTVRQRTAAGQLKWFENDGSSRSFVKHDISELFIEDSKLELADLDSDGDLDLVLTRQFDFDTQVLWLEFQGESKQFGATSVAVAQFGKGLARFATGDYDQDGDLDILTTYFDLESNTSVAYWRENLDGAGTFVQTTEVAAGSDGVESLKIVDWDADGDLDILAGGYRGGSVTWYENTSGLDGPLEPHVLINEQTVDRVIVEPFDFDDDGDLDLVTGFLDSGSVVWYEKTSFGQIESGVVLATDNFLADIALTDIDGDERVDIVVAGSSQQSLNWFANRVIGDSDRDGVFSTSDLVKIFQAGEYEDGILNNSTFDEGDWNGDGDFDSGDLVFAFQAGTFAANPQLGNIAAAVDFLFGTDNERRRH